MPECEYITEVEVVSFGVLRLTFGDGLTGEVDLRERLWGPVFHRVRTEEGFREAFLDPVGRTVAWPGDVDFAPDTLYFKVSTGEWPADLFWP